MAKHFGILIAGALAALSIVGATEGDSKEVQGKPKSNGPPDLRGRALSLDPASLGLRPTPEHPRVWQVLMETGYPEGVATLVVVADGSASLYFSGGGGIIGAGDHKAVREAIGPFLRRVEAELPKFKPARGAPLPQVGRVRFYVRTFDGSLGEEASEDDLGNNRHALSPVFHAGHAVITAMREVTEPR